MDENARMTDESAAEEACEAPGRKNDSGEPPAADAPARPVAPPWAKSFEDYRRPFRMMNEWDRLHPMHYSPERTLLMLDELYRIAGEENVRRPVDPDKMTKVNRVLKALQEYDRAHADPSHPS